MYKEKLKNQIDTLNEDLKSVQEKLSMLKEQEENRVIKYYNFLEVK